MPRANIAWEARLASMKLLRDAYAAFNARDIDAALGTMHPDVVWPNGMEGGYVHGHDAVRAYWTRQWDVIDPHVEPRRFTTVEPDRKSTRLNSSHRCISYAVFCLKKKKSKHIHP